MGLRHLVHYNLYFRICVCACVRVCVCVCTACVCERERKMKRERERERERECVCVCVHFTLYWRILAIAHSTHKWHTLSHVYTYPYVPIYALIYPHVYTCIHLPTYTHIYPHISTCTKIYPYIPTCIHIPTYTCSLFEAVGRVCSARLQGLTPLAAYGSRHLSSERDVENGIVFIAEKCGMYDVHISTYKRVYMCMYIYIYIYIYIYR